jgi:hypothetical protein
MHTHTQDVYTIKRIRHGVYAYIHTQKGACISSASKGCVPTVARALISVWLRVCKLAAETKRDHPRRFPARQASCLG